MATYVCTVKGSFDAVSFYRAMVCLAENSENIYLKKKLLGSD